MEIYSSLFEVNDLTIIASSRGTKRRLIEDFSLKVQSGELVGIVGETGAGKSLSMMACVGLLPSGVQTTGGNIVFNGQQILLNQSKKLRANLGSGIALLFQNARGALNPFMRVGDQIERALRIRHTPRAQRKEQSEKLMRSVGLDPKELSRKYSHQISGGQAQRIAMACALATNPHLLIADEPTTALDVTTEREVIGLFKGLCLEHNMGMVLITHNLALVSQSCDRVVLMHAGHIVESGTIDDLFSNPLHPYTVGLIQAIPDVDTPHDLVPLKGSVWGGVGLKDRCRFSHRCPHVWDRCQEETPPLYQIGMHTVRCFLYDEEYHPAWVMK